MLRRLAEALFKGDDPTDIKYKNRTFEITKTDSGYILSVFLPFADKSDLSLDLKGDELIVRTAKIKRSVALPGTLTGRDISGAKFNEDRLNISFSGG